MVGEFTDVFQSCSVLQLVQNQLDDRIVEFVQGMWQHVAPKFVTLESGSMEIGHATVASPRKKCKQVSKHVSMETKQNSVC